MLRITELSDNQIYLHSDLWQCDFGHGEPVKLGLILEAVDLADGDEAEFSYVVEASLIPQLEYLDEEIVEEARSEGLTTDGELLRYAYESYGGVPVNIDAVQPSKASCGMSSFVARGNIGKIVSESGEEIESRRFLDLSEAMSFARDFYAVYASVLFGFIDVVLDHPLRAGGTGWDRIRLMARK
jgi:hypothetical protein